VQERFEHVDAAEVSVDTLCYLRKLLTSVRLDDIAIEIGLTAQGWRIIALCRPPLSWQSPRGIVNRHDLISGLIESGAL
jgi:hypothetical protein